jgi:prepilin-type N-terminal cleavage/methylation domain-containing protein/prepilin-type processing-associated H-X9-DG protein
MKPGPKEADMKTQKAGFTLIELLVVIASIALVATMLLPALAQTRPNSRLIQCLANQRQLAAALIMYAEDHRDYLVPNRGLDNQSNLNQPDPRTDPTLQPGGQYSDWCPGNMQVAACAARYNLWIQAGLLYPYLKNLSVYRCPADRSMVPRSAPLSLQVPSWRTYSMNCWVGSVNPQTYAPVPAVGTPGYAVYTKLSDMARSDPGKTWVFIEESPICIDDAYFTLNPTTTAFWYNVPAVWHGNASVLAFADGHADAHRWTDSNMIYGTGANPNGDNTPADSNSPDLAWLISVSTAHR